MLPSIEHKRCEEAIGMKKIATHILSPVEEEKEKRRRYERERKRKYREEKTTRNDFTKTNREWESETRRLNRGFEKMIMRNHSLQRHAENCASTCVSIPKTTASIGFYLETIVMVFIYVLSIQEFGFKNGMNI